MVRRMIYFNKINVDQLLDSQSTIVIINYTNGCKYDTLRSDEGNDADKKLVIAQI